MSKTHLKIIREKLRADGEISRDWCLQRFITRLASRITDLKKEGWIFTKGFIKTEHGKDYVYKVLVEPNRKQKLL